MNGRSRSSSNPIDDAGWMVGGGEMGERTRAFDWEANRLGPIAAWPQSLRTAISIMLGCEYPLLIWWGPELIHFYNDAYMPVLGQRHPKALGQPAPDVWSDAWPLVGPQADAVMQHGRSYWNEELLIIMTRNGYPEEVYMTFSYGPIRDDAGGIGGIFCACTEETARVVDRRRLRTLRALADRSSQGKTVEEACEIAATTLGENTYDLPFVLLYLLDADGRHARLAGATGLAPGAAASPIVVEIDDPRATWPLRQITERGQMVDCEDLTEHFGVLPGGPWPEPTRRAVVLPLLRPAQNHPAGFLIAGIGPRRPFDDGYRDFLALVSGQVATLIGNARAHQEEQRRIQALAELDRAKTAFFSNVSHEFRTPLTLMLGPLEDILAAGNDLPVTVRHHLDVAYRNSQRLLRLVNSLLDFSRIEAGRIEASYEPTDLSTYTAELASVFRSAIERAGLRLVVDCPPHGELMWVDHEMWEKIVLNLLSNAFKFTFAGEIVVSLRREGEAIRFAVRDTGTGIAPEELPHVFERFHRVHNARGRTFEGSGIGLSLVQEMVRLHGGNVDVESEVGHGSTFAVTIPLGNAHLPADRLRASRSLATTGGRAETFVAEVLRWLPSGGSAEMPPASGGEPLRWGEFDLPASPNTATPPARVLVVDDNPDMREYLVRLLEGRFEVEAAGDGQAALEAARLRPPDLVLADVMMPRLDGFQLLAALRADKGLQTVPVIVLSARAGEEARVEGLEAGADDYLVKPFSARELLARVEGALRLQQVRHEAALTFAESEARLADAMLLQAVSGQLLQAEGTDALYGQILDAAVALMRADAGSIQGLDPTHNELVLLAQRGFAPASSAFWQRVDAGSGSTCGAALAAAERVVVPDVETAAFMARTGDLESYRWSGIRAVQSTPLVARDGRAVGMISTHWHTIHQPTDRELGLLDVLARQAADLLERARAVDALRRGEERYRSLFEAMDQGFCTIEVLFDEAGLPTDYVFLETNPAFDRNTGLGDVVGKRMRELRPTHEEHWFAIYGRIAHTGVPERFEAEAGALGRWYNVYAYRVGEPTERRVAILFEDITERKRADAALRETEEHQRFLLTFYDALRAEPNAGAVADRAIRMLIEHLRLDRSYIVAYRLEDDRADLVHQVGNDTVPPLPNVFILSDYPAAFRATLDQTLVIEDELERQGLSDAERRNSGQLGMRAMVAATLRKGENKPLWSMIAISSRPRHWTRGEIALVKEVAERTWTTMERARAEAMLRDSEEKYRTLFDSIDEGLAISEMVYDDRGEIVDMVYRQVNRAFERHGGVQDVVGRSIFDVIPGVEAHWLDRYKEVARTGEPAREENYQQDVDRWFDVYFSRVDEDGRFVATVFNDITGRKRAEIALRESEERQAFLLELSDALRACPDEQSIKEQAVTMLAERLRLDRFWIAEVLEEEGIALVGPEHVRPDLTPMAGRYQLSDYPEIMRQLATQAIQVPNIADDPRFADAEKALLGGLHIVALLVVALRKGSRRVIWAFPATTATPRRWTDGERVLLEEVAERTWAAVERARAEAALRDSEARFRTFAEFATDTLWIVDAEHGQLEYLSPAFEQMWGEPRDAVMADLDRWTDLVHPDDRAAASEAMRRVVSGEVSHLINEYRIVRPADGTIRWIYDTGFAIHDASGAVTRVGGIAQDVTDKKRAETVLRESEASLQRQVTSATTDLRALSRRLLTVQEEERRHLARELAAAAGKTGQSALAEAHATVQTLTEQVRQLSMDLRPAVLDSFGLLAAVQWHLDRARQRTGVNVDLRHHGLGRRFAPEIEITAYRVVQEALTNVARHAETDSATVHLFADSDSLTVSVRDDGRGFDPEQETASSGLSGIRERVALLGGTVEIEAVLERGTTITAEIPFNVSDAEDFVDTALEGGL